MTTDVYAYKNVKTGEVYAFGEERPDLDARPNWEKVDVGDEVPEYVREQIAAQGAAALSITQAGKTRESQQAISGRDVDDEGTPGGLGGQLLESPEPVSAVSTVPGAYGGVLSRNLVHGPSQAELKAKAVADTEALEFHGVLADQIDGAKTRVEVPPLGPGVLVENAEPVGDTSKSGARKKASAAKRTAEAVRKQAPPTSEAPRGGGPVKPEGRTT